MPDLSVRSGVNHPRAISQKIPQRGVTNYCFQTYRNMGIGEQKYRNNVGNILTQNQWNMYSLENTGTDLLTRPQISTAEQQDIIMSYYWTKYGPLARNVKLRVAHAPGIPGTFSPPPRVSDPDMHHGTCVTHVPWCMLGSLTSGFLWSWRRGKTFPAFPAHAQSAILRIW